MKFVLLIKQHRRVFMNYKKNTNYLNIPSVDAKDLYIANHQEIHKQKNI